MAVKKLKWIVAAGVLAGATAATTTSLATTGASTGLPVPKVKVLRADGEPFEGRYVLASIDRTAQITGGQISIDYTETGTPFLVGFAEFATFDTDGRKTLWTANLYPFTYAHQKLSADVLSQATNDRLGGLVLNRPDADKPLTGTLTVAGLPHPVTFRKIGDDESLHGKLPAVTLTATRPLGHLATAGWGATSSYAGRYRLSNQDQAGRANAAIYATLVQLTNALSSDQPPLLSADLALSASGGTLTLTAPGSVQHLELTDLRSGGTARTATLRDASSHAVVGHFDATRSGDTLTGSITVRDEQINVSFEQYTS
jgi:hypothetical protein